MKYDDIEYQISSSTRKLFMLDPQSFYTAFRYHNGEGSASCDNKADDSGGFHEAPH